MPPVTVLDEHTREFLEIGVEKRMARELLYAGTGKAMHRIVILFVTLLSLAWSAGTSSARAETHSRIRVGVFKGHGASAGSLQKALEAGQMPGQAHLIMGILEGTQDNRPACKKHFAEAERIARQTKDADLAERVEIARVIYSDAEGLLRHLMDIGGSGLVEEFLNDLDEEFDDD